MTAVLTAPPRPTLGRLTAVELRKMVDTRAGRWLLVLIALSAVAMMPVVLYAAPADEQSLGQLFAASQIGVSLLLPVLGIMSVTSEWSQRTALATFTLVPERSRILTAKLLGGACLAGAFVAAGIAVGFLGRVAGAALGRSTGSWSLPLPVAGTMLLFAVIMVSMGVAFGMLFMNPPLAIVLYFLLPTLWTTLGQMVPRLEGPARWLDTNRALDTLTDPGVTATEWARIATSLAVWLLVPLAAGTVRLVRREVK
ncbi:ABC transporter permease subunit [Actinomadura violacea]|uniref:ABC transporter permease subunit n=1 Tax=Actinomadura violacea TaxID=2819934 RepID=A0ABS3S2Q9_9ACTN|nr:ABC transporter permease subunit [Actinomadura violacea]MBO2462520.1 ABC transporter permease subunit [Actinomadura violacea]